MRKLLFSLLAATFCISAASAQWTSLGTDPVGDQSASPGLDGTKLEYRYDGVSDSVWFRVTVNQFMTDNYGINIILDVTGGGTQGNWWGYQNATFKYNRLITAWISSGSGSIVGISDAAGAASSNFTNIAPASKVEITTNASTKTYTIGMKRTDIYNGNTLNARVIAATGSNSGWGDDVPNSGFGTINLTPTPSTVGSIAERQTFRIYPNPSNGIVTIDNNSDETVQIKVYDVTGTVVHSATKSGKQIKIELNHLQAGNYFIKLSTNSGIHTEKLLIK